MSTFLEKFTNFGNFSASIFIFFLIISILTWLISKNYFRNKINKVINYNNSLQEQVNVLSVEKEQVTFEKNTYISTQPDLIVNHEVLPDLDPKSDSNLSILTTQVSKPNDFEIQNNELEQKISEVEVVQSKIENLNTQSENQEIENLVTISNEEINIVPAINDNKIEEISVGVQESKVEEILSEELISITNSEIVEVETEINDLEINPTEIFSKIDDLKLIEGIGFKIQEILNAKGISSFEHLASMQIHEIKSILEAAGSRFSMHDPSSWPQQAMLARDGEWPVLRRLQDELDKGKIVK